MCWYITVKAEWCNAPSMSSKGNNMSSPSQHQLSLILLLLLSLRLSLYQVTCAVLLVLFGWHRPDEALQAVAQHPGARICRYGDQHGLLKRLGFFDQDRMWKLYCAR